MLWLPGIEGISECDSIVGVGAAGGVLGAGSPGVRGGGTTRGSVEEGGIYRETVTREVERPREIRIPDNGRSATAISIPRADRVNSARTV